MVTLLSTAVWCDKPAWVIPDVLNARAGPGTDEEKIGTVSCGDQVIVTAFRDDHWCKALLPNGKMGWLKEDYLQFSAEKGRALARREGKPPMAVPAWVSGSVVNVREGPSTSTGVVRQLKRGRKLFVTGVDGNWRKVKTTLEEVGWIRSDLLELDIEKGRQLAAGRKGSYGEPAVAWIRVDVANVRSGPALGYRRVGQLTKGTKVRLTGAEKDWVRCKRADLEGWIHIDLVETDEDEGQALARSSGQPGRDKGYCTGDDVALRAGPATNRKCVRRLSKGTALWILDEKQAWCQVQLEGGTTGWMAGWYVKREGESEPIVDPPAVVALTPPGDDFPSPSREPEEGTLRPFTAWIAGDRTNVRAGPGLDYELKFQLGQYDPVVVMDTDGQWCKVRTSDGKTGWTAGWVLDFQPPGSPEATADVGGHRREVKVGWVDGDGVHVRAGPGTDTPIVGTADEGEELVVVGSSGDWLRVVMEDGVTGWIAGWLIRPRTGSEGSGAHLSSADVSLGRRIVRTAMKYLGRPYSYGAEGPYAFDCSGFTWFIYRKFGIELNRSSSGQYRQGEPVSRDSLQPGDVVLFRNTYKRGISHAGIYIGQNKFIHASSAGSKVKISGLHGYYADHYAGARRMY